MEQPGAKVDFRPKADIIKFITIILLSTRTEKNQGIKQ
jgi:hypothetical protein